ncbi:hypothetical protein EV714DRAFT_278202 [Schizophyllum commune]
MLNFSNPDLDGQPSRPLVRLPRPVSPSQNEIRPSNDPRSPRASRDYDTSGGAETMQAAESGRRSQGERVSDELAEGGAGPSYAPLGNLPQGLGDVGGEQQEDLPGANSREQQVIAVPQEADNGPQASSSQGHHDIGDSSNAPGATSGEEVPELILSAHDRATLNDILAHPEAYQTNVEFQLAADSPQDDPYPQLAPSPDSLHPALYAPLSRTIPLPALEEQGLGVAPAQLGSVASSSGNADAEQTTGAPLSFPSLETSSTHSESSALLHYSPAAEAETRRYDEGSARRELAAMMSDPPPRVVDQEGDAGQQQHQSVALDAAPASHGEAFHPSSSPQHTTPPDDDAQQSRDGAGEASCALREQVHDATYIHCRDLATNGVFIGRKLLIIVGKRSELPQPSQPFNQALNRLLGVCDARRHDFTQLELELLQVEVIGGQHDTRDALETILAALNSHLRIFLSLAITFKALDDFASGRSPARVRIARSFSRLTHVRISGKTSADRLNTFALENLHILEVLTSITEGDVRHLIRVCGGKLAFLAAGPIDQVNEDYLAGHSAAPTSTPPITTFSYPPAIHISSPFSCAQLLAEIPSALVDVRFTLTDASSYNDVKGDFDNRDQVWTLRLSQ